MPISVPYLTIIYNVPRRLKVRPPVVVVVVGMVLLMLLLVIVAFTVSATVE
jgi:hypothetical protein